MMLFVIVQVIPGVASLLVPAWCLLMAAFP